MLLCASDDGSIGEAEGQIMVALGECLNALYVLGIPVESIAGVTEITEKSLLDGRREHAFKHPGHFSQDPSWNDVWAWVSLQHGNTCTVVGVLEAHGCNEARRVERDHSGFQCCRRYTSS